MATVLDGFESVADILEQYDAPKDALDGCEVLFATYTYESYEGDSTVLFRKLSTGELFEVTGGHCSCNGLEGQWTPTPVTVEALKMRTGYEAEKASVLLKVLEANGITDKTSQVASAAVARLTAARQAAERAAKELADAEAHAESFSVDRQRAEQEAAIRAELAAAQAEERAILAALADLPVQQTRLNSERMAVASRAFEAKQKLIKLGAWGDLDGEDE